MNLQQQQQQSQQQTKQQQNPQQQQQTTRSEQKQQNAGSEPDNLLMGNYREEGGINQTQLYMTAFLECFPSNQH